MDETFKVLFVCSGNSCRSPMAEGLLKVKLPEDLKDKTKVASAGTLGLNGNPATEYAIQAAGELGAAISQHRSQGMSEELAEESDIIFVMSREHKAFLDMHFPQVRENIFLLRTFGRDSWTKRDDSIDDPIGHDLEVYRECAELISSELDRILPRLQQLIEEKMET